MKQFLGAAVLLLFAAPLAAQDAANGAGVSASDDALAPVQAQAPQPPEPQTEPLVPAEIAGQPAVSQPAGQGFVPTRLADLDIEVEAQRPPLIPTTFLSANSVLRAAELSPDGTKLAFILDFPLRSAIAVVSADTNETLHNYFLPDGFDPTTFGWAGNERLIVWGIGIHTTTRYRYRVRRLFLANLGNNDIHSLIADPFVSSYAEIIGVSRDGSYAMIAHADDPDDYDENEPAVYRYGLTEDLGIWLEQERVRGISDWTVDDTGTVRLGVGREGESLKVWYRAERGGPLVPLDRSGSDQNGGAALAMRMSGGSNRAYVMRSLNDAPIGLHLFDFASGEIVETLYQNDRWDVEDVWFREGQPLAISFTDDARRVVWLNEADQQLYDQLHAALGGGALRLMVTSRSRDNSRMLVWAGDEADPGVLYLFDREKRDLKVLAPLRPELDFTQLVRPYPITYTARDGTAINGYLTLPRGREPRNLPLILMPHGGPFGIRDTLAYNDELQLLANRGYAVLQPNFRGSGGYGDEFYDLGIGEVGRGMQDDIDDAMDWAVSQGIADADRVCLVGGSYGGFAALWAVIRNPERYRCAASWAGVTDWDRMLRYDRRYLSRDARRSWRRKIEGEDDFDMESVSPQHFASRLNRPVLLAHGTRDTNVPFSQFEQMVDASEDAPIPPTELVVVGAGHSFTRKRDQNIWFIALDSFLAKHNPADQLNADGEWVPPRNVSSDRLFVPLEVAPVSGSAEAGAESSAESNVGVGANHGVE